MSDYEVGYGKPPRHSRWRKNVSGNPGGRPPGKGKKAQPMQGLSEFDKRTLKNARRLMSIRVDGQSRRIPTQEAVLRQQTLLALQKDGPAQERTARHIQAAERREQEQQRRETEVLQQGVALALQAVAHSQQTGEEPADIFKIAACWVIEPVSGKIIANGPRDLREFRIWERAAHCRELIVTVIENSRARQDQTAERDEAEQLGMEIKYWEIIRDAFDLEFPGWQTRREFGFDLQDWREQRLALVDRSIRRTDWERPSLTFAEFFKLAHPEFEMTAEIEEAIKHEMASGNSFNAFIPGTAPP